MEEGRSLNEYEMGRITELVAAGYSINNISKALSRSRKAVQPYCKDKMGYEKSKSTGRPKKASERKINL